MFDVLLLLWLADGWRHGVGRVGGGRLDPRQDRQSCWHREPLSLALSLSLSHTHTHSHTLTYPLSLSLSLSRSLSLSLSLARSRALSRFVDALCLSGSLAKG